MYCGASAVGVDVPQFESFYTVPLFTAVFFHFQDSNGGDSTYIRFLLVQPKSLQECKIIYEDAQQKAATQIFEEAYSSIKACIF